MMKRKLAIFLLIFFITAPLFALKPGTAVEDFALLSTDGTEYHLSNYSGEIVCLIFWSANSPLIKSYEYRLIGLFSDFALKGIQFFGIASNVDETPDQIRRAQADRKIPFPILLDPESKIADYLAATRTPEIFIIDRDGRLAYRGGIDNESWANHQPTKHYVRDVLDQLISGNGASLHETKAYGTKIKRKENA